MKVLCVYTWRGMMAPTQQASITRDDGSAGRLAAPLGSDTSNCGDAADNRLQAK